MKNFSTRPPDHYYFVQQCWSQHNADLKLLCIKKIEPHGITSWWNPECFIGWCRRGWENCVNASLYRLIYTGSQKCLSLRIKSSTFLHGPLCCYSTKMLKHEHMNVANYVVEKCWNTCITRLHISRLPAATTLLANLKFSHEPICLFN